MSEVDRNEETAADDGVWARDTAPQTPYSSREVGIGLVVFAIGTALAFVLPLVVA